ncbi:DUF1501 domain-containing protein [Fimbriiglobus ruber]|uniref:DUF1501 domain-containing protein n=1 Tax=Fimbriiglobus ruber TaxID=1908690 RepID=A0A225CYW8_9BACT|nr:DUF1501 domain-containing protein [Fimbriiglobus ruber]OWK34442.1 hypothetical protein FRUB_10413 [Fimbriiglobus ruber]
MSRHTHFRHPFISRRAAIQAGAIGLLGLGSNHIAGLQALAAENGSPVAGGKAKAVIYIFLSGGLSQHESFDMKPDAPENIRGEFRPIATRTPGVQICEHLPMLAARSQRWALVRSLTHPYTLHSLGHHVMLTGRTEKPAGFSDSAPRPTDFPAIASVVTGLFAPRNNLPPAAVLPEKLVHVSGRTIPGQFAGEMGPRFDPWFIEASNYRDTKYVHGAFPEYGFQRQTGKMTPPGYQFAAPRLELSRDLLPARVESRVRLLESLDHQHRALDHLAATDEYDRHFHSAASMLLDGRVHRALDVHAASTDLQERYGRNSFGWSLLLARQLIEAGVRMVQVNLGNDESWDTHENAFGNLKNYLLPPTDRAVSTLLDDLHDRGLLDDVLIVMAGEFGRTPRVFVDKTSATKTAGRDHWGMVQTVFFAGGGVKGGTVIGSSDKIGGYPATEPQKPENMAATIYQALGVPQSITWKDSLDRPHNVYHGDPIRGLT